MSIKKLNEQLKKYLTEDNESIVDFIENKLRFFPNIQTDEEMDEYLDDILAQAIQEFEDTTLDKTLTIKYPEYGVVRYYPPDKVLYVDGSYYIDYYND